MRAPSAVRGGADAGLSGAFAGTPSLRSNAESTCLPPCMSATIWRSSLFSSSIELVGGVFGAKRARFANRRDAASGSNVAGVGFSFRGVPNLSCLGALSFRGVSSVSRSSSESEFAKSKCSLSRSIMSVGMSSSRKMYEFLWNSFVTDFRSGYRALLTSRRKSADRPVCTAMDKQVCLPSAVQAMSDASTASSSFFESGTTVNFLFSSSQRRSAIPGAPSRRSRVWRRSWYRSFAHRKRSSVSEAGGPFLASMCVAKLDCQDSTWRSLGGSLLPGRPGMSTIVSAEFRSAASSCCCTSPTSLA